MAQQPGTLTGRGVIGPMAVAVGMVMINEWLVMAQNLTIPGPDGLKLFNPRLARPLIGGVIATIGLTALSTIMPRTAVLLAWTAVAGTALVRIDPNTPSPAESLLSWYNASPTASPFTPSNDPRAKLPARAQQKG